MIMHDLHEQMRIRRAHEQMLAMLAVIDNGRACRLWREAISAGANLYTLMTARALMMEEFRRGAFHPASPATLYALQPMCQTAHMIGAYIGAVHRELLTLNIRELIEDAIAAHADAAQRAMREVAE